MLDPRLDDRDVLGFALNADKTGALQDHRCSRGAAASEHVEHEPARRCDEPHEMAHEAHRLDRGMGVLPRGLSRQVGVVDRLLMAIVGSCPIESVEAGVSLSAACLGAVEETRCAAGVGVGRVARVSVTEAASLIVAALFGVTLAVIVMPAVADIVALLIEQPHGTVGRACPAVDGLSGARALGETVLAFVTGGAQAAFAADGGVVTV